MSKMKTVTFVARPAGEARADNFRLTESDMPKPAPGQVLVKTRYLSLDPYFIRVMTNVGTYTRPLNPGDAMFGRGIGEIVESNDPAFAKGEFVLGTHDWQEYCALGTAGLTKVEADFTLTNDGWLNAEAARGQVDMNSGALKLEGGIAVFSDQGYELHTDNVSVDLNKGVVLGPVEVTGHGPLGDLRADHFQFDRNSKLLTLDGHVHMRLAGGRT